MNDQTRITIILPVSQLLTVPKELQRLLLHAHRIKLMIKVIHSLQRE